MVWRGAGDLLQVPWARGPPGRWLLLDLCAGYSGLCIAALSAGLHFWALAVESDEQACKAARAVMPSIVHVSRISDLDVEVLLPFLRRRQPRGILIGTGASSQTPYASNTGGPDQDDFPVRFPEWVRGFAASLRDHAECCHLEVLVLGESFLDGEDHTCAQVSEWMDAQPIVVQAADCGWLSRHRAYWLRGNSRALSSTTCTAPQDWAWDKDEGGRTQLRYTGQKPIPSRVHFEGGLHPLQDPALVMKGEAAPFFEFAPEFWRAMVDLQGTPAQAVRRFRLDAQRFPPASYVESSLVWKGDDWRQLSPLRDPRFWGSRRRLLLL